MTQATFIAEVLPARNACYRFARTLLHDAMEAEDVAQEIMLRLWNRRAELHRLGSVEAFAIRATRNLALDRMRRAGYRTRDIADAYDLAADAPAADAQAEHREGAAAVLAALRHLPETQRAIVHLREVEGHSHDEIAEALALSKTQVKVYLHRARKRLRELLDPTHAPSHDGTVAHPTQHHERS